MQRIMIVSDSHRRHGNLAEAIYNEQPFDLLIHLGDIEGEEDIIQELAGGETIMVPGNNDFFSPLPREREIELAGKKVLLTHGHFDHIMAAKKVKEYYQIPVYAGIHEEELLADAQKNLSAMWAEGFTMKADELVVDNQKLEIAGMKITVIETPGHTSGGVCYYIEKEHVLFAGDTLFFESYGRTDFSGGSMFSLIRSLGKKLFVLPDETDVYPGHGQATSIGYEKTHNPAAGMR